MKILTFMFSIFLSLQLNANGLNIYGLGVYDIKLDGSDAKSTADIRYEKRFDKTIFNIGPKEDNFFFLKPFIGFEYTGDSASYFLTGIYLDDNIGQLFKGKQSNMIFTPSIGFGYYDNGSGKNLGNDLQFRTTFELSYILKSKNRIGLSVGHISNANLGDKNPGVEIISLTYQVPY
ncbi:acyloxyacyl hydrolase [Pelagibacteraceae bacterium]|nr:acyloxyacyl hydrolase [Pelagibacteraceae bacterium]